MDDFEFPDSYDYSAYNEVVEPDDEYYEGNGIGQDMSEYDGDLTEGDWSDVFDPGDEIVDEDGEWFVVCDPFNEIVKIEDNEDREDSGCP